MSIPTASHPSCLRRLLALAFLAFASFGARADLLHRYRQHLTVNPIPPTMSELPPLPKCRDRDDQMFLELAQYAKADLLISRDNLVLKLARARQRPCPFAILPPDTAMRQLFDADSGNTSA